MFSEICRGLLVIKPIYNIIPTPFPLRAYKIPLHFNPFISQICSHNSLSVFSQLQLLLVFWWSPVYLIEEQQAAALSPALHSSFFTLPSALCTLPSPLSRLPSAVFSLSCFSSELNLSSFLGAYMLLPCDCVSYRRCVSQLKYC